YGVAELAVGGDQACTDAAGRAGDDGDFLSGVHCHRPAFGSGSSDQGAVVCITTSAVAKIDQSKTGPIVRVRLISKKPGEETRMRVPSHRQAAVSPFGAG